jgi:hypothetical protein
MASSKLPSLPSNQNVTKLSIRWTLTNRLETPGLYRQSMAHNVPPRNALAFAIHSDRAGTVPGCVHRPTRGTERFTNERNWLISPASTIASGVFGNNSKLYQIRDAIWTIRIAENVVCRNSEMQPGMHLWRRRFPGPYHTCRDDVSRQNWASACFDPRRMVWQNIYATLSVIRCSKDGIIRRNTV